MKRFIHEWWLHAVIVGVISAVWYVAMVHP
jgi:hypothetical protein